MKIIFFIDVLPRGGKERRLVELMKGLKAKPEIDFELVVMDDKIQFQEVLEMGINIHYMPRRSRRDLSVFNQLFRICRDYKPDVLHCWDSMTAIYACPVCKLLKIKMVNGMITNAPQKQKAFNKMIFRAKLTFPFSDIIVSNSRAGLVSYNAPKNKSTVIYNGFNFQRINKITPDEGIRKDLRLLSRYTVGMVASFSEKKDYKTFFEAAQLLLSRRKDITFLAIGNYTDSQLSRAYIKDENLEFFRLLGTKSQVEPYVNLMDIGVLCTFTEGISNSIMEYMALGKPVVATTGGGTPEILIDGKTGFLVKPADPVELATKIEVLLNDRDLRASMGKNGRQRVMEDFSIDKMVESYVIVYNGMNRN